MHLQAAGSSGWATASQRASSCASCNIPLYLPDVLRASAGGGLIGLGYGVATRFILRFLQRFGATAEQQIALTLACGYLSFYTANAPAKVSGAVIRSTPFLMRYHPTT